LTLSEAAALSAIVSSVRPSVPPFIDATFPEQARFIRDPSRRKYAFCTRRAGKSEAAGRYLLKQAFEKPGTQCLYVGLTRGSARAIMWAPILKRLLHAWGLEYRANEVELEITLPNASRIRLTGADANDNERQKLLGQRNSLVILDECASFRAHIKSLVWDVLRPTLVDELGTMCMIGTPGEVPAGYFYEITTGREAGWSAHTWTTHQNPYLAENFATEIAELKQSDPDIERRPWFRRQYLGQWVVDTDELVYHFNAERNTTTALPLRRWIWILGVDLGWEDATAFSVLAWSPDDPNLYVVHTHKRRKMTFDDVDATIRDLSTRFGAFAHIVIDNANKQGVEDMRARFGWAFESADKAGKMDHVGLLNNDLRAGRIKFVEGTTEALVAEYANLVYHAGKIPPREDPACENHIADATLYAYVRARHYTHRAIQAPPADPKARADWEMDRYHTQELEQWEADQGVSYWER
jgi:phage terminase large subunit